MKKLKVKLNLEVLRIKLANMVKNVSPQEQRAGTNTITLMIFHRKTKPNRVAFMNFAIMEKLAKRKEHASSNSITLMKIQSRRKNRNYRAASTNHVPKVKLASSKENLACTNSIILTLFYQLHSPTLRNHLITNLYSLRKNRKKVLP